MDYVETVTAERPDEGFQVAASVQRSPVANEQLSLPIGPPIAVPSARVARPAKRVFAGFTYAQLIAGALVIAAAIWGMWATSKIFALQERRVVSVRLATIVNDFVSAEARSGTPPDQLAFRTKAFMTALDGVLKVRAARGQVVLVGEAVVASSVPDVTSEIVADLAKVINLSPPSAMPPPIMPPAAAYPSAAPARPAAALSPSSSAPSPTSEPEPLDPLASPFGAPAQPTQQAPEQ